MSDYISLGEYVEKANTGADAIKRAPIVDYETEFRCLRIGDISNDRKFEEWGYTSADEKIQEKFTLRKNDLVIARTGNTIGVATIIKDDVKAVYNNGLIRIKLNEKCNPYFIYLLVKSRMFKDFINQISGGTSTQPNVKIAHVLEFKIPNLSIEIQNKIANLLIKFDEKINTNNSIIENLENISQEFFKRWFIDFEFPNEEGKPYKSSGGEMVESDLGEIPSGWQSIKLGELECTISDHVANGSFKSLKENVVFTELANERYAIFARNIDLKKRLSGDLKYITKESYAFLKKSHLFGGEIIVSNVGDVGTIHRCPTLNIPMVLGNNQIYISSKKEFFNEYLYLLLKSDIGKSLISSITSGSVQMKFNKTDFRNSKIILPSEALLKIIFSKIKLDLDLIEVLNNENKHLQHLRDTLLPKLLSGEIEIPDELEV